MIRWARAEPGADRIRLFVRDDNERAAACYRRLGFVFTGASLAYPPDPTYTEPVAMFASVSVEQPTAERAQPVAE
jgi:RimJ/RimL family protein N-acetyltransferase